MRRPAAHLDNDPDGVVDLFLDAYRQGAFPMADFEPARRAARRSSASAGGAAGGSRRVGGASADAVSIIRWYSPDPRAILPLDSVHVSRTLRRLARRPPFEFTSDVCFERVIRACAEPRVSKPGEPPSLPWLDEPLIRAYCLLHDRGHAHSIEAWITPSGSHGADALSARTLVGGIYGVHIGSAFFAESMFCRPHLGGTNASNLCLIQLVAHLRARGFVLLDVQLANPHTERFGLEEIPRASYLRRLAAAVGRAVSWAPFGPGNVAAWLKTEPG